MLTCSTYRSDVQERERGQPHSAIALAHGDEVIEQVLEVRSLPRWLSAGLVRLGSAFTSTGLIIARNPSGLAAGRAFGLLRHNWEAGVETARPFYLAMRCSSCAAV